MGAKKLLGEPTLVPASHNVACIPHNHSFVYHKSMKGVNITQIIKEVSFVLAIQNSWLMIMPWPAMSRLAGERSVVDKQCLTGVFCRYLPSPHPVATYVQFPGTD
jgi:hypothetical protein